MNPQEMSEGEKEAAEQHYDAEDFKPLKSGHVHACQGGWCPDCGAIYLYPGWDYSNSTEKADDPS